MWYIQACFDEDDNDSSLFPPSIIHNDYFAAAEAICVVFFLHVRNGLTYTVKSNTEEICNVSRNSAQTDPEIYCTSRTFAVIPVPFMVKVFYIFVI